MSIVIGCKYQGKAFHLDTQAGTYFEVLPSFSLDEERLQGAFLNQKKKEAEARAKAKTKAKAKPAKQIKEMMYDPI